MKPTDNLVEQVKELLSKGYFPRYEYQLSYSATFSKYVNREEYIFHKWVKSDIYYIHVNESRSCKYVCSQDIKAQIR